MPRFGINDFSSSESIAYSLGLIVSTHASVFGQFQTHSAFTINQATEMASDAAAEQALPEGVHHYDNAEEVPFEISKYWHQRYDIFSKYDEGIWMTDDAWFGVTPEPVAK